MRTCLFLITIVLLPCSAFTQMGKQPVLRFNTGNMLAPENVSAFNWDAFASAHEAVAGKRFAILQFNHSPDPLTRQRLALAGVQLTQYVPDNGFVVAIAKKIGRQVLQQAGVRSITDFAPRFKLAKAMQRTPYPAYAIKKAGTVDVLVHTSDALEVDVAIADIIQRGYQLVNADLKTHKLLTLRIVQSDVDQLAGIPYITFIQPAPPPDKKLNDEVRSSARANVLNAPIASGGENLMGKGVVIGVGDNADITSHVDLQDRVINRAAFLYENHGTQTSGTAAGAGIIAAIYKGVAPMATIVSQVFGGILKNAATYVADYGMVVTNNSYGSITGECDYVGVYDLYSKMLDDQAFTLNELLHVFAAGNDGSITCPGYSPGDRTALGGYQSAKNVLTVGWGEKNNTASVAGSHGPAADGRIKPEITAVGSEVRSTGANNTYITDWGSSMAAPAVAGGAALLIEKYRGDNAGANPKSALVKALLMNGANDVGVAGPDYRSGFGFMNLNRSLDMLKSKRYITGKVATGSVMNHNISVPAGTSQVKLMLYWHDPSSAVFSAAALVNNLDLELVTPANATILPWVLDSAASRINSPAVRGFDAVNNVEQVTLNSPAAGNYTMRVKGTAVNMNPEQEYILVYDFLPAIVDLTFPSTGEPLVIGETITVNWDAWDEIPNPFTLQFSPNDGATWTDIATNVDAASRQYNWVVPAVPTSAAKMRLLRNGTNLSDESLPFVIARETVVKPADVQCTGYFSFTWNPVEGATGYEVMMKKGTQMETIATTTNTNYVASALHRDSTYWFTTRALINGKPGRRGDAISIRPNTGTCAGNISDNDLTIDSVLSPRSGRQHTSTRITNNNLVIRVRNLDDVAVTGFTIRYSIDGEAYRTENVGVTIPALGNYNHSITGLDFSRADNYQVRVVVENHTPDPVSANDTLTFQIRHLANEPITLPFVENFETAPKAEVIGSTLGLPGLPRWDLLTTTPFGRARTFVNTGIALNGSKAITLDVNRFIQTGNTSLLVGTFNLENYSNVPPDQLGLTMDFWFKHHGQNPSLNNRVWVRFSDANPWLPVYNLDSAQAQPGVWKKAGPMHLSRIPDLGQLTQSVQVRIGQRSVIGMGDDFTNGGITIDSFRLFTNTSDFAVLKIDTPIVRSCGLNQAVPLRVLTANYNNIPVSVPIRYSINNGAPVSATLPPAAGVFSFPQPLNLSAPGRYTIKVWVDHPADTDRSNDTATIIINNQPVVSTFPYLQNFENGQGNWYAEGQNSSWQFGTPSSIKINTAASGSKAWKTSLQGSYNDEELSYLYSPCFNLSGLNNPWLSLSMALDFEQCRQDVCDATWIEYSVNGLTWTKLGVSGQGLNWYNRADRNVWDSAGFKRWHSAGIALPKGLGVVQLRVVVQTDQSLIKEGIAVDDVHIYDREFGIYTGQSITNAIKEPVAANKWHHFTQQQRVFASVNPGPGNLGNTASQVFTHQGGFEKVRNINGQYFLDRSFTVKPGTSSPNDSTTIRLYFTDAETDTLVRASNCLNCSKPASAYELGITQYNDVDDRNENGDFSDNFSGEYHFINANKVAKVPYDVGYYAEFKVKHFSEFWLNNGGPAGNLPIPIMLSNFTVVRQSTNTVLQWTAVSEVNLARYEVQVAAGNNAYSQQQFITVGNVQGKNMPSATYTFTDTSSNKTGARYYRLKMVDQNGMVTYSSIRVLLFDGPPEWSVYPNPVQSNLQVITQANAGNIVVVQLLTISGQVLLQQSFTATGFAEKTSVQLNNKGLAAGMYIVKITSSKDVRHFKVVKQ